VGATLSVGRWIGGLSTDVSTGYTLTLLFMMSPVVGLLSVVQNLQQAATALNAVEALGRKLAADAEPVAPSAEENTPKRSFEEIELRGIRLNHAAGDRAGFVLGPVDLTIRPGKLTFVVGGNGSGKSTLVKVLTGLYPPDRGSVFLDGVAITDESRDSYRQNFSVILQNHHLFERLYGMEGAQLDDRARGYLEKLRLAHKVTLRDGAFSTIALSQGERKRLALLSVWLEDRPVYVFDEWAADQDPSFKKVFYTEFLQDLRGRGKAVVVITHDERYFNLADEVIKLEDGKILDEDTRTFLLRIMGETSSRRPPPCDATK
jgi:putative ATP-binding cassette transporter